MGGFLELKSWGEKKRRGGKKTTWRDSQERYTARRYAAEDETWLGRCGTKKVVSWKEVWHCIIVEERRGKEKNKPA